MTSYKTILESVKQLKTNKMKALILDLRMIGGRDKDAAIKTADLFLDEGDNIGVIKIRNRNNKFKSSLIKAKSSKLTDVPIVVLIDMGTHAGAELVAMALKENKRALFVGVYTQGDSVLGVEKIPLDNSNTVKLATATFTSPSHLEFGGVLPDKEVKIASQEQRRILFSRFKKAISSTEKINDQQLKTAIGIIKKKTEK